MSFSVEIRYALLISAASCVWLLLEYAIGLHGRFIEHHMLVAMFALVIPAALLFLALRQKQTSVHGIISPWRLLGSGVLITAMSIGLVAAMQAVYVQFINPGFVESMIAHAYKTDVLRGRTSPEQAMQNAKDTFSLTSYLLQSAIGLLIFGTLFSAAYAFTLHRYKTDSVAGNTA